MRKNFTGSTETLLVRYLRVQSGKNEEASLLVDADLQFSGKPAPRAPLPDITELRDTVEQLVSIVEKFDTQILLAAILDGLMSFYPHLARADVTLWQVVDHPEGERLGLRGSRERFPAENRQGRLIRQPRPR